MHVLKLMGCTATPFGSYLKALGVLRLVSEQADSEARGWWDGDVFQLESKLDEAGLEDFFLARYSPTPIVAPWNSGSGFYPKEIQGGNERFGLEAISATGEDRFAEYRKTISLCGTFPELLMHVPEKEENARRTLLVRRCRNTLPDRAVEWLDAVTGIAADGDRYFAPILCTGGNEGHMDYTANFMSRIASLLIKKNKKVKTEELLRHSLWGLRTTALQEEAAGQFDPGRAGGANQGQNVKDKAITNPWDFVLTMEGTVAWASGVYRKQGLSHGSVLCSPFTVWSRSVGYGSAAKEKKARAEVWTPLWTRPTRYQELKILLREGRAQVGGRLATDTLGFSIAVSSLGVDRGVSRFVRYNFLERRGKGYYVALPAGSLPVGFRRNSDLVREFHQFFERVMDRDLPKGTEELKRTVESAIYQALLVDKKERIREMMRAIGKMLRRLATTSKFQLPRGQMKAHEWLGACGFSDCPEVRIAAAVGSIWGYSGGWIGENLSRESKQFAWTGNSLARRMSAVLDRRLQTAAAGAATENPTFGKCALHPGDATLFIEGSVDDGLIEDLLFAFVALNFADFKVPEYEKTEPLPVYALLKHLFLPGKVNTGLEEKVLRADPRILSLLEAGALSDAAQIATQRLRVAGMRPLDVIYEGGVDAGRLAGALLIPVWSGRLSDGLVHEEKQAGAYA